MGAFSLALGDARGSLPVPESESVTDGEWILAIFEIGSKRRATAAAARAVCASGDPHITFERRDWDRLVQFVAARSEHMKAAKASNAPPSMGPSSVSSGRLPVSEAVAIHEADNGPPSVAESSRVPFGARILLVDDDAETRQAMRTMLAEIGLIVEVADSAAAAQVRVLETTFDALVLDFHGALEGGIEPLDFVRSLRRDPLRAPLPVLILSDRPSSRDVVEAFASGADDFLPKPFRTPELGARIFGLLRRARLAKMSSLAPSPNSSRGGGGGIL